MQRVPGPAGRRQKGRGQKPRTGARGSTAARDQAPPLGGKQEVVPPLARKAFFYFCWPSAGEMSASCGRATTVWFLDDSRKTRQIKTNGRSQHLMRLLLLSRHTRFLVKRSRRSTPLTCCPFAFSSNLFLRASCCGCSSLHPPAPSLAFEPTRRSLPACGRPGLGAPAVSRHPAATGGSGTAGGSGRAPA